MVKKTQKTTSKIGRSSKTGQWVKVKIASPAVKPKRTTIKNIRSAVRKAIKEAS